jgi:hypothetical protein
MTARTRPVTRRRKPQQKQRRLTFHWSFRRFAIDVLVGFLLWIVLRELGPMYYFAAYALTVIAFPPFKVRIVNRPARRTPARKTKGRRR